MPEFILDTSGHVPVASHHGGTRDLSWAGLDAFTQGYVEALFFTESEPSLSRYNDGFRAAYPQEDGDEPDDETAEDEYWSQVREGQISELPADYGFADLAPETLERIWQDCHDFQRQEALLLEQGYARGYAENQAGTDFWFTRNRHGAGFWDRGALSGGLGEKLSDQARGFGGCDTYLGDDGKVYLA